MRLHVLMCYCLVALTFAEEKAESPEVEGGRLQQEGNVEGHQGESQEALKVKRGVVQQESYAGDGEREPEETLKVKRGLFQQEGHNADSQGDSGESSAEEENDDAKREEQIKTIVITKEVKVHVPRPYPVTVEKKVPVEVKVPYPVKVPNPYPVEVYKPYPVYIEKKIPVAVEKKIPYPVRVEVKVPVPIPHPVYVEKPIPITRHVPKPYPVKVPVYVEKKVYVKPKEYTYEETNDHHHFQDHYDKAKKEDRYENSKEEGEEVEEPTSYHYHRSTEHKTKDDPVHSHTFEEVHTHHFHDIHEHVKGKDKHIHYFVDENGKTQKVKEEDKEGEEAAAEAEAEEYDKREHLTKHKEEPTSSHQQQLHPSPRYNSHHNFYDHHPYKDQYKPLGYNQYYHYLLQQKRYHDFKPLETFRYFYSIPNLDSLFFTYEGQHSQQSPQYVSRTPSSLLLVQSPAERQLPALQLLRQESQDKRSVYPVNWQNQQINNQAWIPIQTVQHPSALEKRTVPPPTQQQEDPNSRPYFLYRRATEGNRT